MDYCFRGREVGLPATRATFIFSAGSYIHERGCVVDTIDLPGVHGGAIEFDVESW